jgi:SanA protein
MNRKKLRIFVLLAFILLIAMLIPNYVVKIATSDKTYNSTLEIPSNKVGLILGTSKFLRNGNINLYYKYRIDAAVQLFKSNKIQFILVSGDNSKRNYNEPTTIKNDLVSNGVPESRIFLDYAGFRTLDSVIRSREIFGQDSITIISQRFHNERAIYLARHNRIYAIGFNAKDVGVYYGFKTKVRELIARDKMFLDLIIHKKSKFLGDRIEIK